MRGECSVGPVLLLAREVERRAGVVDDQFVKAGTPMNWFVRDGRDVEA